MNARVADASQIRVMRQGDIEQVAAIEQRAYAFPWTPGIFRDCLRVGHECWVLDCRAGILGYGVLSCAAGEAHEGRDGVLQVGDFLVLSGLANVSALGAEADQRPAWC